MNSKYFSYSLNYLRVLKGLKTPLNLIHLVTSRCNMRCSHCFYWKELNKGGELNLDKIELLVKSLKNRLNLLMLGGGEPFLRDDLGEICDVYIKHNKVRKINIVTNGYLSEKIYDVVKDIKGVDLTVQVSLDGLEKQHDEIRNSKGGFRRVVKTVDMLKNLDINIGILTVVSNHNYKNINGISDFVQEKLKVGHSFELIRGTEFSKSGIDDVDINPKAKDFRLPPKEELDGVYLQIKSLYKRQTFNWRRDYGVNLTALKMSIEMLKKNRKIINCSAGRVTGVIYPDGDVSLCELTKPFANLREFNFDFYKLWSSDEANEKRSQIKNCFCTHGCFLQPSIVYSPRHVFKILKT